MTKRKGFDSAVTARDEDHLNRWPVAQEIFGIAKTCPEGWSVRIGIYGAWGTGKTSVLNFVESMARRDNHLVVLFNPWEYATRDSMWRAFVVNVFRAIEAGGEAVPGAKGKTAKVWAARVSEKSSIVGDAVSAINEGAGKVVNAGIELLKTKFSFDEKDLKELHGVLGSRKLIVLIDDLDRTSPDLVPEMLFALKEIMDIPGFAFICAFDPVVVGEVLGLYHPGFGNGLKFLEKIIDYPRWLQPPSSIAMGALVRANIQAHCPYVPLSAMEDILPVIPPNPRVVRQLIRLLALMEPQIKRHDESELSWPPILSASVLKVLYPKFAQMFFPDESLWDGISSAGYSGYMAGKGEDKAKEFLVSRVQEAAKQLNADLGPDDEMRIVGLLQRISKQTYPWVGDLKSLGYRIHISEFPHCVTFKEYREFLNAWDKSPTTATVDKWMSTHSDKIDMAKRDVYLELLDITLKLRDSYMGQAADASLGKEQKHLLNSSDSLLNLLEQLVFDLGDLSAESKSFGEEQLEQIFSTLRRYLSWTNTKEYRAARIREKKVLRRLVLEWGGDLTPIIKVLHSLSASSVGSNKATREFTAELNASVSPRYAKQILAGFRDREFVGRIMRREYDSSNIEKILLDATGPLWKGLRRDVLKLLGEVKDNADIQLNAVNLFYWFDDKLKSGAGSSQAKEMENIFKDKQLCLALWKAATATPINPRFVGQLQNIPATIKAYGIPLKLPRWWIHMLKEMQKL